MNGRKLIMSIALLAVSSVALSVSTIAWFDTNDRIDSPLGGSVLKSYFHCGTGTSSDPFVITRPVHLYNLIYLQTDLELFDVQDYYFSFGYDLNDDGNMVFFNYDDDGIIVTATPYSTSLNMAYYSDGVQPLGTTEHPFIATIEGNGLTVKNLTVDGTGLSDIGIFGYVAEGASVSNIYFESPTIVTTGGNATESSGSTHVTTHTDQVYIGYLCGHIVDSSDFANVYVNNCTMKGNAGNTYSQKSNFGYYGLAEMDSGGNGLLNGYNYSFDLDASSLYSYVSSTYSSNSSSKLVVRNTEYDDTINNGSYTLSTAFSLSSSTYELVGKRPQATSVTRNYSLSTIGIQTTTGGVTTTSYLADSDTMVDSGYNAKNIDIVGGIRFVNSSGIWMEGFMNNIVAITSSDIGNQFYSTEHCSASMILFIRNTGSTDLGTIKFTYTTKDGSPIPQFNKGSSSSYTFSQLYGSTYTSGTEISLTSTNILPSTYCVLDKDFSILGTYNTSGTISVGTFSASDIAYYVLMLGVSNGQVYINSINFDYVSLEGYGGNFGSVDFRSASAIVTATIVTFYFILPIGGKMNSLYVSYSSNTYSITVSFDTQVSMNFFNTTSATYTLKVNGTTYSGSSNTIVIAASS